MENISNKDPLLNEIYFNKYLTKVKLGEGSFGSIYMAELKSTLEKYALKFEDRKKGQNLLHDEAYVMSYLKGDGIPAVKSYGYSGNHNILVMELLGNSLENNLQLMPKKIFGVKTTCMIAIQMITILETIHSKHIIHRDIKPDNFVMGINENDKKVILIDFGLAKKYRSSTTNEHYPIKNRKKLTGTARYASINALKGMEQSRRDDLEAVGYVLMYFLLGSLPWQGMVVKDKDDRYKKIMEKKISTSPDELCGNFPPEFAEYIRYTRNLGYEDNPNYEYLKKLFKDIIIRENYNLDYCYDWVFNKDNSMINNFVRPKKITEVKINEANSPQIIIRQTNNKNFLSVVNTQMNNSILYNHTKEGIINANLTSVQAIRNDDSQVNVNGNITSNQNIQILQNNISHHILNNPGTLPMLNRSSIKVDVHNTHNLTFQMTPLRKSRKENRCCIL